MSELAGQHTARSPMLSGTAQLIDGYARLHAYESKYAEIAIQANKEVVSVWYRYLNLLYEALRQEHVSPEAGPSPAWYSWNLRLRLLGTAAASAKLCLDAALAGYYSQAFSITRHMFETWIAMTSMRLVPTTAENWFPRGDGARIIIPKTNTQANMIRKHGEQEEKRNLPVILAQIAICDDGAHPSHLAVGQMQTEEDGRLGLGATYIESLFVPLMSASTVAITFVLHEAAKLVVVDDDWRAEFQSISEARTEWVRNNGGPARP